MTLPKLPERGRPDRPRIDSDDLARLAEFLNGRITLCCPKCGNWVTMRLEMREMRFGSSPDLSAIDPSQPGRPRLQFWCTFCRRLIGHVQGDEWSASAKGGEAAEGDGVTRWDRLELDGAREETE
jgi:hypothetical protein